jgi:hypothetical protein
LTYLDPVDIPSGSFVMENERMKFFSKNFEGGLAKCEMFNARCRYLDAEQYEALPDSPCLHHMNGHCTERNVAYYGKDRRVNLKSHPLNTVKDTDPCPEKDYPNTCYTRPDPKDPACTCDDGTLRDYSCPDQVGTQGLHNYVLFLTEHAMTLATKPEHDLTANNEEYEIVRAYDNIEWELGNLKAVLLHQHEAISDMHTNTTITEIVYAFLVVVIAAQYFFLGKRIENLMIKHDHVGAVVKRLRREGTDVAAMVKSKKEGREAQDVKMKQAAHGNESDESYTGTDEDAKGASDDDH